MSVLISRKNYIQQLEKLKDEHIVKVVTGLSIKTQNQRYNFSLHR